MVRIDSPSLPIRKLLVAYGGKIAIRICRAATVATYSAEDRFALTLQGR